MKHPRLVDDQGVVPRLDSGDVNSDGVLDPTETWIYSARGIAVAGRYANLARVTALAEAGGIAEKIEDEDSSHDFGGSGAPAIAIEKFTQGADADTAPGPPLSLFGLTALGLLLGAVGIKTAGRGGRC